MRGSRVWWLPGVACLIWLLQWVRNSLKPFADVVLSFDGDVALHIVLGDLMIERGWWLDTEPTNYLMDGQPFIAHEWLAEVVLALSHRAFGLAGPILLTAFVLATLSAAMYRRALARGAGTWPAVVVLVSAFTLQNAHLHPRPHVLTWALGFVFVTWCDRLRVGELDARAWFLRTVPLVVLWAQLHAGFLVIVPVLLAFSVGAWVESLGDEDPGPARRRGAVFASGLVVLVLASGLNPWGFALHAHFLAWLGNDYMTSFTTEFQSPDFRSTYGAFLGGYLGLVLLALAASPRRPPATELFLVGGLMAMALHAARHGAVFATFTMPFVATWLHQGLEAAAAQPGPAGRVWSEVLASSARLSAAERERGGWGLAGLVGVVTVLMVGVARTPEITFHPDLQPVEAVAWIEAHPDELHGRMFNPFRWGAYLAYRLYPEHQVYLNSWHDHLGEDALRTYFRVHDVEDDWERILRKEHVSWVIYDSLSPLARALDADDSWERVYRDGTASVWRLRGAGEGRR